MNRQQLEATKGRMLAANDHWDTLYVLVKRSTTSALANKKFDEQDEAAYLTVREWWLQRWHGFKEDVESLYPKDDDVPRNGINAVERCFFYADLPEAVQRLREYGRDEKIVSATFQPAESFWVQVRGRLEDLERSTPSLRRERMGRVLGWLAGRPDWVEAHPRTLTAFGLLVAGVLAWQVPSILREMTELVRAIRGG